MNSGLSRPSRRGVVGRALLGLLVIGTAGAQTTWDTSLLDRCRALRESQPAEAVPLCRQAAAAAAGAGAADPAFEAFMHTASLAIDLGQDDLATQSLDGAAVWLGRVSDPLAAHRLARRRGMLAYRRGEWTSATAHFLDAREAARALANDDAVAQSENDLGVVQRKLGDAAEALKHFEASLAHKRGRPGADLGPVLDNVGNLYRELGDAPKARDVLSEALAAHQANGHVMNAAHTEESLALVLEKLGDFDGARRQFDASWDVYTAQGAARDQIRLAILRGTMEQRQGALVAAREWLNRALPLVASTDRVLPLGGALLQARLLRADGRAAEALPLLDAALDRFVAKAGDQAAEADERLDALDELVLLARGIGDYRAALDYALAQQQFALEVEQQRHGQRIDGLRVKFDLAEAERARSALAAQNAEQSLALSQRRVQLLGVSVAAIIALALVIVLFQRRLHRQALRAARERAELESRIDAARAAAEHLRADLRGVHAALEATDKAMLAVDAGGIVRAASSAAARDLDRGEGELVGAPLAAVIGEPLAARVQSTVERLSEGEAASDQARDLGVWQGREPLRLRVARLALEEEIAVLELDRDEPDTPSVVSEGVNEAPREDAAPSPAHSPDLTEVGASLHAETPAQSFREAIVSLMHAALDAWVRTTRKTKLDLAERSGIWRITIDEGRLRVRALDRYTSLDTLPERPRWREVLRTAYFVLAECRLDDETRSDLEGRAEALLRMAGRR